MESDKNDESSVKSVDDILEDTTPEKEKRFCKQFIKEGGYKEAMDDFKSMDPIDVVDMPNGKVGKMGILPDGRRINIRMESSYQCPTLEVQAPKDGGKAIKIRYNNQG